MKLLGTLLLTVSLAFGAMAAATAYTYPTSAPDERLIDRTLKFDAGVSPGQTIAPKDTVLTEAVLADLRAAGVKRVHVKQFDAFLWRHNWIFALSLGGLFAGSMLTRAAGRRAAQSDTAGAMASMTPEQMIAAARASVEALLRELEGVSDPRQRERLIIERLDTAGATYIVPFLDERTPLTAALGLAGYARLMDRFSAAERQLNRAWSAAADGALDEAVACLERGRALLSDTAALLA